MPGLEFEDSYSDATQYQVGDVVTYGGYSYTAKQDTKANIPTNTTFWDLLTTGFKVIGEYSSGVEYTPGNVVTQSGYVYVSHVVTTGNAPTIEDGDANSSTFGQTITNTAYWNLLNTGFKFRSDWQDSIIYYLGDTVKYSNSSYVCIIEHTGDGNLTHRPPNATYWDMLSAGESTLTMTQPGDIMIRTATNVNLPMGLKGWKLRSDEGQSHPIHWDPDDRSYTWHVDPYKGEDIEELVYTPGVSVISDYSSSQTYTAGSVCRWAPPIWVTGTTYAVGGIVSYTDTTATAGERIKWYKCIDATNASTAPSTGGTVSAPWKATSPSTTITQTTATDPNGASVFYGKDRLYGENDSSVTTNYNTSEIMYKVYIAVKERSNVEPLNIVTGVANEGWQEVLNGVKTDIDGQATGIITWGKNSSAPFKTIRYASARAVSGDQIICASGVYKEFFPITINEGVSIEGEEMRTTFIEPNMEDDGGNGVGISTTNLPNNEVSMFYCNDGVIVKGFTMRGMTGNVSDVLGQSPPVQPTIKGVCFQLDPNGAINLKSPLIKDCVSINDGGGGIYCDGTHAPNGKYQSICTNNFAQINSDGFGLYATNKGQIEAVSVFTHYNHVGYLTTNGGIIRSAGGGNSYGEYGSASEGFNPLESNLSNKTGQIDNETGEAKAYRVIVDGTTGQVQRMEWQYTGESYTNATVSITAPGDIDAGTSAAGGEATFTSAHVDGGIARVDITTNVSTLNKYTGNAQIGTNPSTGTDATLTLAASSGMATDAINGMILTIVSGTGAGQFGAILSYNATTKIATISDIWTSMHNTTTVVPDTTSVYEIDPGITLSGGGAPTTPAVLRCQVSSTNNVEEILVINPGAGYDSASPPTTLTLVDPAATVTGFAVSFVIKDGVPVWTRTSSGGGYPAGMTSGATTPGTTIATVSGDGWATIPQTGSLLVVKTLTQEPNNGSIMKISGNSSYYHIVDVIGYTNSGGSNGVATIHITPSISLVNASAHETSFQIREEYSSCRMTGHDFLNIGTGDFTSTNYPGVPTQAADSTKEVLEGDGGKVFYTATNQDGNFSVGGLFSIQQSTNKATMNVEDFSLVGVQELGLSSGASVNEFSIDGTLSDNSDSALVTEKAIKTYIASQLGGGENQLEVNTATIGTVYISGNIVSTTSASGNNLLLNSDGGKVTFNGEPQFTGAISTDTTLITRGFFEDNFVTQQLVSGIMQTLENDRVAGTGDPNTP